MSESADTPLTLHSRTARYAFLDLYRGLFVVLMLEGHAVRELLRAAEKSSSVFTFHELLHGITAPGFFLGAGFTFAISAQRKWNIVTGFSPGLFRRLGRALLLVAVGYALHMPFLSLQKTLSHATTGQWNDFLAFGVLQCVGITLFFLYVLLALLRNERLFLWLVSAALPFVVYGSTRIVEWSASASIPLWFRSALTTATGSPYPIFPFAGFILAGVLIAWLFLRAGSLGREHIFILQLFVVGVILAVFPLLAEQNIPFLSDGEQFWSTGPNFFLLRLGVLFILLSSLWFMEERLRKAVFPKWLTMLGVESFFVYIAHLLLLCGWVTNADWNIRSLVGPTGSLPAAVLISIVLIPLMVVASRGWRFLKKHHPVLLRGVLVWMFFSVTYAFLFHPY